MVGIAVNARGDQSVTASRTPQPQLRIYDPTRKSEFSTTDEPVAAELEATAEFLAEIKEVSARLETATPEEILRWAVERFPGRFTMATAFGPEGMVLIHMLAEIAPDTPIFNLDTGYQFPETLELRERVLQRYGIAVEMKRPAQTVAEFEAENGGPGVSHRSRPLLPRAQDPCAARGGGGNARLGQCDSS